MSQSVFAILSWSKEGLRLALMCRSRASSGMKISELSKQVKGQLKLKIMVMIAGPFTTVSCHGKNTNWRGEVNIRWYPMDIQMFVLHMCLWSLPKDLFLNLPNSQKCFLCILRTGNTVLPKLFRLDTTRPDYSIRTPKTQSFPSFCKILASFVYFKVWFDHNLSLTFIDWGQSWF